MVVDYLLSELEVCALEHCEWLEQLILVVDCAPLPDSVGRESVVARNGSVVGKCIHFDTFNPLSMLQFNPIRSVLGFIEPSTESDRLCNIGSFDLPWVSSVRAKLGSLSRCLAFFLLCRVVR
jgi:hypothetical protein